MNCGPIWVLYLGKILILSHVWSLSWGQFPSMCDWSSPNLPPFCARCCPLNNIILHFEVPQNWRAAIACCLRTWATNKFNGCWSAVSWPHSTQYALLPLYISNTLLGPVTAFIRISNIALDGGWREFVSSQKNRNPTLQINPFLHWTLVWTLVLGLRTWICTVMEI